MGERGPSQLHTCRDPSHEKGSDFQFWMLLDSGYPEAHWGMGAQTPMSIIFIELGRIIWALMVSSSPEKDGGGSLSHLKPISHGFHSLHPPGN